MIQQTLLYIIENSYEFLVFSLVSEEDLMQSQFLYDWFAFLEYIGPKVEFLLANCILGMGSLEILLD